MQERVYEKRTNDVDELCQNFNKFLFRNSLLYTAVKKLRKSVNICLSYRKNKSVSFFMAHSV